MSELVVYACNCSNIRIHTSTKYSLDKITNYKEDLFVKEPLPGWEYELGMGGIVIEFNTFTRSSSIDPKWTTVDCLNCNTGHVYSIENKNDTKTGRVVIHENTVYGQALENLKRQPNYSKPFNINLDTTQDNLIPMPGPGEDAPELLASAQKKMQSILDHYVEQLRIESKVRIEKFKKQEEKSIEDAMAHIKLDNSRLWSKLVQVTSHSGKDKEETTVPTPQAPPSLPHELKEKHRKLSNPTHHVRFAQEVDDHQNSSPLLPSTKRFSFSLDEAAIRTLQNKDLDSKDLKLRLEQQHNNYRGNEDECEGEGEDEEDMFNLDEEFSDEERTRENEEPSDDEQDQDTLDNIESKDQQQTQGGSSLKDLPLSASLRKSISDIDQQFAWIKKKRNTKKYLAQDFDIKGAFKRVNSNADDDDDDDDYDGRNNANISKLATSVPITIYYPSETTEDTTTTTDSGDEKTDASPKKRDILASSFANYDSSFSDRMLSGQFPRVAPPPKRKGLASSALIRPQLDSLIGKSLDTRSLLKKKANNKVERKDTSDDEEFDATLPPHVWAASHEPTNDC